MADHRRRIRRSDDRGSGNTDQHNIIRRGTVLDVSTVQSGVLQILSDPAGGYGANIVSDVRCNDGRNPSAKKGITFACDAVVNGVQRRVTVVVSDDSGTYEIDRPR